MKLRKSGLGWTHDERMGSTNDWSSHLLGRIWSQYWSLIHALGAFCQINPTLCIHMIKGVKGRTEERSVSVAGTNVYLTLNELNHREYNLPGSHTCTPPLPPPFTPPLQVAQVDQYRLFIGRIDKLNIEKSLSLNEWL